MSSFDVGTVIRGGGPDETLAFVPNVGAQGVLDGLERGRVVVSDAETGRRLGASSPFMAGGGSRVSASAEVPDRYRGRAEELAARFVSTDASNDPDTDEPVQLAPDRPGSGGSSTTSSSTPPSDSAATTTPTTASPGSGGVAAGVLLVLGAVAALALGVFS